MSGFFCFLSAVEDQSDDPAAKKDFHAAGFGFC